MLTLLRELQQLEDRGDNAELLVKRSFIPSMQKCYDRNDFFPNS